MVRNSSAMTRKTLKERKKRERIAYEESNTVYWLVFTPKPGIVVSRDEQSKLFGSPWRILLPGNPDNQPDFIQDAIRIFETNFNIKSWLEIARSCETEKLYNP